MLPSLERDPCSDSVRDVPETDRSNGRPQSDPAEPKPLLAAIPGPAYDPPTPRNRNLIAQGGWAQRHAP